MVSTQCPKCGKVLNDADTQSEGQAIDKHQKAVLNCEKSPVTVSGSTQGTTSLADAIRKARGQ